MRGGDRTLLASNLYDVYARVTISGVDLETRLGYNPLVSATWTASADQLATAGQISLFRGSDAAGNGVGPHLNNPSLWASPLTRAGAHFLLETATVAKGAAPSGWVTVFDGRIDEANGAAGPSETGLVCRDMMACLMNRIIEPDTPPETPDGKNGFLVASAPLGTWLQNLRNTVYPAGSGIFIEQEVGGKQVASVNDPAWTVGDTWVSYGPNLAEKMNEAVLQRGWAFHYRYLPSYPAGAFTYYDPDRSQLVGDYTVQPHEVIRVLRCAINDQDVTNMWDLIWGRGSTRTRTRAGDTSSIATYGRRYGSWPEDQAGQIDEQVKADRMLAAMVADTKDPIVELDYERLYFWPVELADKQQMVANLIQFNVNFDLAVVGYTHTITPKSMRTTIRTRGSAIAARKRWKRGSPRMVHVATDVTVGIMPEHAIVLTVDDLTPPV